jgi:hypothetical protein
MTNDNHDPADHPGCALPAEGVAERRIAPRKIQRRRKQFIMVPWGWLERLNDASGQTYRLALILLYLHWKGAGAPIKLANGMLEMDGVPRTTKKRALADLEGRGLISVAWRPRRTPVVTVHRVQVANT